ncbi:MAG: heme exporter protein CcmD [Magnetospirillum sp.]|nr:heme exporter protein CcmD [Magnetospirillum sp.]
MTNVMESIQTMLHMGGYGGYIWPAYGISVVVLLLVLLASLAAARKNEAELDVLQQARRGRRNGNSSESQE